MSQCDDVLVSVARIPKVWNDGKNFWGDLADWCEDVFPNANQAEDLENVFLENCYLENIAHQLPSTRRFRWFI